MAQTAKRSGKSRLKAARVTVNGENGSLAASEGETALKIPFGNKETAQSLGARYRAGGWFAPPGIDLKPFQEKGWA